MGIFEFFRKKRNAKSEIIKPVKESNKKGKSTTKAYMELEEFLYLADKMIINNQANTETDNIKAFIKDKIDENQLNIVKEEIKYFMFCLLHFYTFQEIAFNKSILNVNDEKAKKHFMSMTNNSLERAFLTSFTDFNYTVEKYKNRYAKYTQYLEIYKYQDIERSFLECFTAQIIGGFNDNSNPVKIDTTQLLLTARWVFRTYGNSTKLTLDKQNFIL